MEKVIELYNQGIKMSDIAIKLQIPYNTVKSSIRRYILKNKGVSESIKQVDDSIRRCKVCNSPVNETIGKRDKYFCSSRCRLKYWRKHHDKKRV
ncbi:MAG: hypothetical protein J6M39_05790 [Lachnospiraceae bacterium]|nr:hypothetical protein [Lachnospiraceae bacterium]